MQCWRIQEQLQIPRRFAPRNDNGLRFFNELPK